jgi:hypothetical protein
MEGQALEFFGACGEAHHPVPEAWGLPRLGLPVIRDGHDEAHAAKGIQLCRSRSLLNTWVSSM